MKRREWERAIRDAPDIAGELLLVALVIATEARPDGKGAVMSMKALASSTGRSESTVKRRVRNLIAAGWLELTERGGRRGNGAVEANTYGLSTPVDNERQQVTQVTPGEPFSTGQETTSQALSTGHLGDPPLGNEVPPTRARPRARARASSSSGCNRCSAGYPVAVDGFCCAEHHQPHQPQGAA